MSMASLRFITFFVTLSAVFIPLISSFPADIIQNAAEILSNSGYISMALTLQLVSKRLISNSSFATVFSPSDKAFISTGQPSMSLLQFHFSPYAYSLEDLQSFSFGSEIPTLAPNQSLVITKLPSDDEVSINGVKLDGSPIYDDGSLVIFTIEKFFDPSFRLETSTSSPSSCPSPVLISPSPSTNLQCPASYSGSASFTEASGTLRSLGYSIMASFLELQLPTFGADETQYTVFAPGDDAMEGHISNSSNWASVFLRHVVSCQLSVDGLSELTDRTVLRTFLNDFSITVTHSGDTVLLNDVPITVPNLYRSDHFVVHGIYGVVPIKPEEIVNPPESISLLDEVIIDEF